LKKGAKTGVFKKRPYFWVKNEAFLIFGLKRGVKNRKYEPKIVQKAQI
jgi:hypothetical protein